MKKGPVMKMTSIVINKAYYRVEDYPFDKVAESSPETVLRKGVAYRYVTEMTAGIYPYRGPVTDKFDARTSAVGIYVVGRKKKDIYIIRPHSRKEASEYKIGKEHDLLSSVMNGEYTIDQFADNELRPSDIGSCMFSPEIRNGDDFLNLIMKCGIIQKAAPFEPYGRRMEALAVDRSHGVEGANIKNNAKRAIMLNDSMSAAKFLQYAHTWEIDVAVIIKDSNRAMHPMFEDSKGAFVVYPCGTPFPVNDLELTDIGERVSKLAAISNNTNEE